MATQEWVGRTWPEISAAGGLPGMDLPAGLDPHASACMLQEMLAAQMHARAPAPQLGAAGIPVVPLNGHLR